MNQSPYLISGKERRDLKKEVSQLKRMISQFWYWENFEGECTGKEATLKSLNQWKVELKMKEALLLLPAK